MKYSCRFHLFQMVTLIHDPEALKRMVTQITVAATGIRYELSCADKGTWHYEGEIQAIDKGKRIGFNIETP